MKLVIISLPFLAIVHVLPSSTIAASLKKANVLAEQQQELRGSRLIPSRVKKQEFQDPMQMHMLARGKQPGYTRPGGPSPAKPVNGCIACFGQQVTYGKYHAANGDQTDNSYYLFKNPAPGQGNESLPIIVHFHAGGVASGGPWKHENGEITSYLSMGFALVSVGYRSSIKKYFYDTEEGEQKLEELIHVSKEGELSLDTSGKTMEHYKVRIGSQELMTKKLYDATQVIESLIDNADKYRLDVDRIVFIGASTGGAAMQYLSWVYHKWHVGRYTPRGMVYNDAQLNYPVYGMLEETWDLFTDILGTQAKLSDVVNAEACPSIVGNHMCGSALGHASAYNLCNATWHAESVKRFCGDALYSSTIGEVRKAQLWTREDEEVGRGMEKLWYASENMQKHVPSDPFYIYVANSMNGTGAMDVAHHSIFALNFARYAEMGEKDGFGLQYTVYYTDFANMKEADRGMQRFEVSRAPGELGLGLGLASPGPSPAPSPLSFRGAPGPAPSPWTAPAPAPMPEDTTVFNYLSTHGWREVIADRELEAGSSEERVLYACLAAGVGPFKAAVNDTNTTVESGTNERALPITTLLLISLFALFSNQR